MKKKYLIVIWLACIYSSIFITLLYAKENKTENEIIKDIQEKYTVINEIKSYKKVEKDLMNRSTEGGVLTGYFDSDELRKIVAVYYGEMGKAIEEYYFFKGNLFFVSMQYQHYIYPLWSDTPIKFENPIDDKIGKISETRYYFKDNRMIKGIDSGGGEINKSVSGHGEREKKLLENAKEFIEILKEK